MRILALQNLSEMPNQPSRTMQLKALKSIAHMVRVRFKSDSVQIWLSTNDKPKLYAAIGLGALELDPQALFNLPILVSATPVQRRLTPPVPFVYFAEKVDKTVDVGFYTGVPIVGRPGKPAVGTLCLLHDHDLQLSLLDQALLEALGVAIGAVLNESIKPADTDTIIQGSPEAILLFSSVDGISTANKRFTQLTGSSTKDLSRVVLDDLLCLDRPHAGAQILQSALLAQIPASAMTRCLTKAGGTIPVELFLFPLLDNDGEVTRVLVLMAPQFSGSVDDFLLSLSESERKAVLDQHVAGLWATDDEGRLTELSGSFLSATGTIDPAHFLAKRLDDIGLFEEAKTTFTPFYEAIKNRWVPPNIECSIRVKDTTYWFAMRGFRERSKPGIAARYHGSFRNITDAKLARQLLEGSERKFKDLTSLSSDWNWSMDANHRFTAISYQVASATGLTPDKFIGKTRWEASAIQLTKGEWDAHREILDSRQDFRNFEFQTIRPDGRRSWSSISGAPRYSELGEFIGFHGVGRDITERKVEEQARRESEERLALILEGTNEGAWDWNLVTGEIFLSNRWWAMLGYDQPVELASPTPWREFIHLDDKAKAQSAFSNAVALGLSSYQSEFRMRHKDGHWIPVLGRGKILFDTKGNPTRTAGANVDLTEIYKSRDQLIQSEALLSSLVAMHSDWYWEQDASFRFTVFKAHDQALSDLSLRDLIGKTRWEMPRMDANASLWDDHKKMLEAHLPFKDIELQYLDAGGKLRWLAISGEPVFDEDRVFIGYRGTSSDITKKKL
jgi:PAS domain S-box-containing protein